MSNARQTEILNGFQEGLTKYAGTITSDHAYVHKGLAMTAIIDTGSISAAYNIGFKTPKFDDGKFIHWRPVGISTSADYVAFSLYEGNAFTSGTAVVAINRNRNLDSTTTKMQTFVKGATATATGTIIQSGGVGTAGIATARSGGGESSDQELLLKPDTEYLMRLTPAGATTCVLELFWYEEEGYVAS